MEGPAKPRKKLGTGAIIGIVAGSVVVLAIAGVAVWYFFLRKKTTTTTGTTTGGTTPVTTSCTSDSSCSSGTYCISGTCKAAPTSCTADAQCGTGTGRYCSTLNNKCQNKCTIDSQCTSINSSAVCNTTTNKCQLQSGGSCVTNNDCTGGQICSNGSCVYPAVGEGQSCSTNPCLTGLSCYQNYCRNTCTTTTDCTGGYVCSGGACIPPSLTPQGGSCTLTSQCQTGLVCTNAGSCQPAPSSCTAPDVCEQGLSCISNTCVVPNGGLGSVCTGTGQGTCNSGYNCINNSCQVPPTAGLGQSCVSMQCGGGLFCNQEGVCGSGAGVSNGGSCADSTTCYYGSYCNSAGTCTSGAPKPSGTSCTSYGSSECNYSLQCINTTGSLQCQATTAIPFCQGAGITTVNAQQTYGSVPEPFYQMDFGTNPSITKQAFLACTNQPSSQSTLTKPIYAFTNGSAQSSSPSTDIIMSETNSPPFFYSNVTGTGSPKIYAYNAPANVILPSGQVVPLVKLFNYLGNGSEGDTGHLTLPKDVTSFTSGIGSINYSKYSNVSVGESYVVKLEDYP